MDPQSFPQIPLDLLEALTLRYPESSALPGQTLEQLMWDGGQRQLIRDLKVIYEQQQNPNDDDE